ncbi:MAG: helix-turn-helix domain-containing protein [Candidatus Baltobacteraceae bacterium]
MDHTSSKVVVMKQTRQAAPGKAHDKASVQLSALEKRRQVIEKGLMRVRAVRDMTGMSRAEIYRLCHAGTFRFRRMPGGRGMLVYRESVEQFIAAGLDGCA